MCVCAHACACVRYAMRFGSLTSRHTSTRWCERVRQVANILSSSKMHVKTLRHLATQAPTHTHTHTLSLARSLARPRSLARSLYPRACADTCYHMRLMHRHLQHTADRGGAALGRHQRGNRADVRPFQAALLPRCPSFPAFSVPVFCLFACRCTRSALREGLSRVSHVRLFGSICTCTVWTSRHE